LGWWAVLEGPPVAKQQALHPGLEVQVELPRLAHPMAALGEEKKHDLKWMIVMVVLMFRQKVVSTFNQVCRIHTKKRGCTRHSRWGLSCGSNGSCDGCKLRRPYLTLNKNVNDG